MNTTSLIRMRRSIDNEVYNTAGTLHGVKFDSGEMKNTFNQETDYAVFVNYDVDFLIDYIVKTYHNFATKNTTIIYVLMQKVSYAHSERHPELQKFVEVAFCFFQDLLNQMLKEEQYLFPYISQTLKDRKLGVKIDSSALRSLNEKIDLQKIEHAKSLNYLKVFRRITNDYSLPSDACWYYKALFEKMKELEHDLIKYFHLEDNILFYSAIAGDKEYKPVRAFNGHLEAVNRLENELDKEIHVPSWLKDKGIDMDIVTNKQEDDRIEKLHDAYATLLKIIAMQKEDVY